MSEETIETIKRCKRGHDTSLPESRTSSSGTCKECEKERYRNSSPEIKERYRLYNKSSRGKERHRLYNNSSRGKERRRLYEASPEAKERKRLLASRPEFKEHRRSYDQKRQSSPEYKYNRYKRILRNRIESKKVRIERLTNEANDRYRIGTTQVNQDHSHPSET